MSWRNDGIAKVTGKAKYSDDIKLLNMLHCVPVYSKAVHAKIKKLDCTNAIMCDGVIKVITHKDIIGNKLFGQIRKDYPILAFDKIRFEGDVVALIVAETREQAIFASNFIELELEEYPKVLSITDAKEDKVLVHEEYDTNLVCKHKIRKGDIDWALQQCDQVFDYNFSTNHFEHAYLEPESAVCSLRDDGVMEIYGSMQHPFSTRRFVASTLGCSLADVEVITIPMGGGFGGKDDTAAIVCARCALASYITKRPVKLTYDREWSMKESYKRHPYEMTYKVGVKDNRLFAVKCNIDADAGAYNSVSNWVTWRSTVQCCGTYEVPHIYCDVQAYYTNNVFTGAFRGFGSPQVNFAIEQIVDDIAQKSNISSIDFRKSNFLKQGSYTPSMQKLDNHKVSITEVFDKAITESEYKKKISDCSYGKAKDGKLYGIGLASSYRGCSLGAEGKDFCSAIINVQFDGSILLEVGIHENGQGSEQAMINILADNLGVSKDRIRYRRSSTSQIPDGGTTVASRGTLMGGGALMNAIDKLKRVFETTLIDEYKLQTDTVFEYSNDSIKATNSSLLLSWEELIQVLYNKCTYPYAFGSFKAPDVSWDEETGRGKAYFTYVYSSQVAELEIDIKSKKIDVKNIYAVHDIGKAINNGLLSGQIYGGIMQGLGMALKENMVIEDGFLKTDNYHNYRIYRSHETPNIYDFVIENEDSNSPSGAKGIGEPALEIIAPAVANALFRATGKRFYNLPMMQEEVCKHL